MNRELQVIEKVLLVGRCWWNECSYRSQTRY